MDSEVTTNPVKPVFNREREGNNSIKRLQKMLSSSSLRSSGTIDEEKPVKLVPDLEKPVDENKKQDLKNISEERDDTMSGGQISGRIVRINVPETSSPGAETWKGKSQLKELEPWDPRMILLRPKGDQLRERLTNII